MTTIHEAAPRDITLEQSLFPTRPIRLVMSHDKYNKTAIPLTRAELVAIVQAAYDQHGIIASPSYAKEAEVGRLLGTIEDAREVSDQADYLAAHDPAQTTIDEQIHEAESWPRRAECTELTCPSHGPANRAARANLDALREKLTGGA